MKVDSAARELFKASASERYRISEPKPEKENT
jgi:hypothetical protein